MIESPGQVLKRHGLWARKSWGQNFLVAPHVHAAIVAASGAAPGVRVVEIGAGVGTLTAHLVATGAEVWAIERDRDLCTVLRAELGDAVHVELAQLDLEPEHARGEPGLREVARGAVDRDHARRAPALHLERVEAGVAADVEHGLAAQIGGEGGGATHACKEIQLT